MRRGRRGAQTLVETALCLVFVVLPLFGAGLQFAIVINAMHSLEEIARQGARYASVHGGETTIDSSVTTSGSLDWYVKQVCSTTSINFNDLTDCTIEQASTARASGQPITVRITYPMTKKMIFIPAKWSSLHAGPGGAYTWGTYMSTLAQPVTLKSTFVLE